MGVLSWIAMIIVCGLGIVTVGLFFVGLVIAIIQKFQENKEKKSTANAANVA